MTTTRSEEWAVGLQGAVYLFAAVTGAYFAVVAGPEVYVYLFVPYPVRALGLAGDGLLALYLLRLYGAKAAFMVGLTVSVIELTWNLEYLVSCPGSLAISFAANPDWRYFALAWVAVPFLVWRFVSPGFGWRAPSTLFFFAFQAVFVLAGTPVTMPYCLPHQAGQPWNWPWEVAGGFANYWFMARSWSPRR